jgi:general stress protein 26
MANSSQHANNSIDALARLREIVTDIKIAMITSAGADGVLSSRPMYLQLMEEGGDLWFATSDDSALAEQIRAQGRVVATFAQPSDSIFAVVRGTASLHRDPAMVKELWNVGMKVWFPNGPSDPAITLVQVHAEDGDYWDAPGGPARVVTFIGALLTGTRPATADRGHVHLGDTR